MSKGTRLRKHLTKEEIRFLNIQLRKLKDLHIDYALLQADLDIALLNNNAEYHIENIEIAMERNRLDQVQTERLLSQLALTSRKRRAKRNKMKGNYRNE